MRTGAFVYGLERPPAGSALPGEVEVDGLVERYRNGVLGGDMFEPEGFVGSTPADQARADHLVVFADRGHAVFGVRPSTHDVDASGNPINLEPPLPPEGFGGVNEPFDPATGQTQLCWRWPVSYIDKGTEPYPAVIADRSSQGGQLDPESALATPELTRDCSCTFVEPENASHCLHSIHPVPVEASGAVCRGWVYVRRGLDHPRQRSRGRRGRSGRKAEHRRLRKRGWRRRWRRRWPPGGGRPRNRASLLFRLVRRHRARSERRNGRLERRASLPPVQRRAFHQPVPRRVWQLLLGAGPASSRRPAACQHASGRLLLRDRPLQLPLTRRSRSVALQWVRTGQASSKHAARPRTSTVIHSAPGHSWARARASACVEQLTRKKPPMSSLVSGNGPSVI